MSVWGVCVSGQEPACLQGTQDWVVQALLAEQLPPLLPKPEVLAAQIQGGCRSVQEPQALGQREMAKEVLATATAWQEQACPRLIISERSGDSTHTLPHVIVWLRDSSQHLLGEIWRETLCKTIRGSGRQWPALTKRDSVILGEEEHKENRPLRAQCCSVGTTQKLF